MASTTTELVPTGEHGPFFAVCFPAFEAYDACDFAAVVAEHDRHAPWLRALGDADSVRYLQYVAAMALAESGQTPRATALVGELLAGLGRSGDPLWRAKGLALSTEVSLAAGLCAQAVEHLADAFDLLEDGSRTHYNWTSAAVACGVALQAAGVYEDADALLRQVLAGATSGQDYVDAAGEGLVSVLAVLPDLVLLHASWAASAELSDDPAAPGRWAQVLSLALRWRGAAQQLRDEAHLARARACEAFAWQRLGDPLAAAAAAGGADLLADGLGGRLEGFLARLYLAGADAAAGRTAAAHDHLRAALQRATLSEPGVWTATVLAAQSALDLAERGPHPAVERWRHLAQGLLGTLAAQSSSFASEVAARRRLRQVASHADAMSRDVLTDPLTGLANRRALDEALDRATRSGTPVGACFVDVDRFKDVNDRFSHAVGDEVLVAVARALTAACREGDLVARYGGDEFVVLTAADAVALRPVAQRVRSAVAAHPWSALAEGLEVTVSVGVAPGLAAAAVLASADAALQAAKRGGRDRVVLAR